MFTYIYIYIFFYFTIYIFFLVFFLNFFKVINIEKVYLTYLLNILRKYNPKNPIPVLLFLLSGLPPVGLFFIKFNFLLTVFYNVSFLFQLLIFMNILLTMFFYLQIYNTNNSSQIISTKVVNLLKSNKILLKNNFKHNNSLLVYYTKCLVFLFINFFAIFFFADLYLIVFNYNL